MKKRNLLVAVVVLVALLLALSVPAYATAPTAAAGSLSYVPTIVDSREAGGNTFLKTIEVASWTGAFVGGSTEEGRVVIHRSGAWTFNARSSFQGTVNGRSGTLEMLMVGGRADEYSDWFGQVQILSGTGDLEHLRGHGTFWGPGYPVGDIEYSLNIHFEPH